MANIFNKAKNFITKKENIESLWNTFTKPDIKKQLNEYGAETTAITIFNQAPKITIENKELQEIWDNFANENKLLYNLSIIEEMLYKNGFLAVGFDKGKEETCPLLIFGIVEQASRAINELGMLSVLLYDDAPYLNKNTYKRYELLGDNFYTTTRTYNNESNKLSVSNDVNHLDYIPLIIFENLPKGKADLDLINPELFEIINFDLELLIRDGYSSLPWVFYSDALQNEYGKLNFFNLDLRVIPKNALNQIYSDTPIELLQPSSTSPNILSRLDKNLNLVKELANLKQSTQSMGTKNLHGDEVQALNSNFETLIEFKANLREYSLKKLVELFFKFINREIKNIKIDVEVKGSTKYQQNILNVKYSKLNGAATNAMLQGQPSEKINAQEYEYEFETT